MMDCLVSADDMEIIPESVLLPLSDLAKLEIGKWYSAEELFLINRALNLVIKKKKYKLDNWEIANKRMNKRLTPIIIGGRNIYE